jgi:hypothetical protein
LDFYGNSYFTDPFIYSDDNTTLTGYNGVLGYSEYHLDRESLTCIDPYALKDKETKDENRAQVVKISISSPVTHIYDYAFQDL